MNGILIPVVTIIIGSDGKEYTTVRTIFYTADYSTRNWLDEDCYEINNQEP